MIGVDDLDLADIMSPRPTLIAQPILDMTRTAIALLLEQVATGAAPRRQKRFFEPKLVERDSCGPAPNSASLRESSLPRIALSRRKGRRG